MSRVDKSPNHISMSILFKYSLQGLQSLSVDCCLRKLRCFPASTTFEFGIYLRAVIPGTPATLLVHYIFSGTEGCKL